MQALWADDEASFEGEHVRFSPSWSWPKPVQLGPDGRRRVPVLHGGAAGPKLFAHIAEYGDGWIPIGGAGLTDAIPRLREAVAEAGRDPDGPRDRALRLDPRPGQARPLRAHRRHRVRVPPPERAARRRAPAPRRAGRPRRRPRVNETWRDELLARHRIGSGRRAGARGRGGGVRPRRRSRPPRPPPRGGRLRAAHRRALRRPRPVGRALRPSRGARGPRRRGGQLVDRAAARGTTVRRAAPAPRGRRSGAGPDAPTWRARPPFGRSGRPRGWTGGCEELFTEEHLRADRWGDLLAGRLALQLERARPILAAALDDLDARGGADPRRGPGRGGRSESRSSTATGSPATCSSTTTCGSAPPSTSGG